MPYPNGQLEQDPASYPSDAMGSANSPTLPDYARIIWKRKWLVAFLVVTITTVVTIKTYSSTPLYEGVCKILIDKEKTLTLTQQSPYASSWDPEFLATQYKILTSERIVKKAISSLKAREYPEFKDERKGISRFMAIYKVDPIRNTRIVSISAKYPDPYKAAFLANEIAQAYIDDDLERKLQTAQYTVKWLSQQLTAMQEKLKEGENAVLKYLEQNSIVGLPAGIDISEDQSKLIQRLSEEKSKLETELLHIRERYKGKYPKILQLSAQLDATLKQLEEESKGVFALRRKQTNYRVIKREVDVNQKLFDALLDKIKEADLLQGLKANNIFILDEAQVPNYPVWPKKMQNILIAFVLSMGLGLGLAFVLEQLDTTFKNDGDVDRWLRLPVLGHIPLSSIIRRNMNDREIALACFTHSKSNFAEAYRYVRTGIAFSAVDKPYPVLLVTSTYPKEGKTTEASNLAITMASTGEKVLLIDADLRKPTIHKVFPSQDDKIGLTSYLLGNQSEESVVTPTEIPNLSVVRCGQTPPNPAEILESQKMKTFLEWARTHFKRIILDTSPVMAVADAIALATLADGVIYVIKANTTSYRPALQCIDRLRESRAKILGVVLNQVSPKGSGYYYQYYYRYKDYSHYGDNHRSQKPLPEASKVASI